VNKGKPEEIDNPYQEGKTEMIGDLKVATIQHRYFKILFEPIDY